MTIWWEVEDALEEIIDNYTRVNHVISFFQDDRARLKGLDKSGCPTGVVLELGSGPGNFTRMLCTKVEGHIVCMDYSVRMLPVARASNMDDRIGFVQGIFEALPFREGSLSLTMTAYALRDSKDMIRVLQEIRRALKDEGKLVVIDIGKPSNLLISGFFSLYMRHIVPVLAGVVAGYGYRNPWGILYDTYAVLPIDRHLLWTMEEIFGGAEMEELAFGGLVVILARKGWLQGSNSCS
ncbi:MAG: class I SAM-dependent methyltransferase [Candidatus Bathyarchaeota archaeon]|nr:MAG: class I SAM-dependent methyltransferase [Candidatus Bathyarchaeota archaeon]